MAKAGGAWRLLPHDFPPWQTVYWYFAQWHDDGTVERVHDALRDQVRAAEGRKAGPTAAIVDSQSVKGADTVGAATRGFDAGKRINGRKRFLVTDTLGLILTVAVTAASVHDTVGGRRVLFRTRQRHRTVRHVWADSGFAGKPVEFASRVLGQTLEIVRKPASQKGFEVHPRRWVIERTNGWITGHRRLARDYERHTGHSEAMIHWTMIGVIARRLTRDRPATRNGPVSLRRTAD
jgi:transposase